MVTINYTLTKEDYSNFYHYVALLSPGKKNKIIKTWITRFLLFSFMLFIVKISSSEKTFDAYFFYSIFVLAAIYLLPLFNLPNVYKKQVTLFTDNPVNANIFNEYQITVSETGLFAKGKFTETKYQWGSIVKKEENSNFYFLFISSEQAILIPKKTLRSGAEKEQLEKLFAQYISFDAEVGHLIKE
jgi:YcxB-like protein